MSEVGDRLEMLVLVAESLAHGEPARVEILGSLVDRLLN